MGLENMISKMPKKRLELFKNLVSVSVIFTIIYSALVIMFRFSRNPLGFFKTQEFIYVCLVLIALSIVWKLLNGSKMNFPNDLKQKPKQSKPKVKQPIKQPVKKQVGSWNCPKCNTFVIGEKCPKCGYEVI